MGKNSLGRSVVLGSGNNWIRYERTADGVIQVTVNEKVRGELRMVERGWQFWPRGHHSGGHIHMSLRLAKQEVERGL